MCFPARQQGPALLITHGFSPWLHVGLSRCFLPVLATLNTPARPHSLQKSHPSAGTQCHACFLPVCDTKPTENISLICFTFWHPTLTLHIVWKYKTHVACTCSEIDHLHPTYKTSLKTMQIHFLSLQVTSNLSHKDLLRSRLNWLQRRSPSPLKETVSTILCLHLINQPKLSNLCYYLFNRPAPWRLLCRASQPMGHTDANHCQPQFPHLWQLCMTRGTRTKELQVWETKY